MVLVELFVAGGIGRKDGEGTVAPKLGELEVLESRDNSGIGFNDGAGVNAGGLVGCG